MSKESRKILPIDVSRRDSDQNPFAVHITHCLKKSTHMRTDKLYVVLANDENSKMVLTVVSRSVISQRNCGKKLKWRGEHW